MIDPIGNPMDTKAKSANSIELSEIRRVDEDAMTLVARCDCGSVKKFEFDVPLAVCLKSYPEEEKVTKEDVKDFLFSKPNPIKDYLIEQKIIILMNGLLKTYTEKNDKAHDALHKSINKLGCLVDGLEKRLDENKACTDTLKVLYESLDQKVDHINHVACVKQPEFNWSHSLIVEALERKVEKLARELECTKLKPGLEDPLNVFDLGSEDAGASVLKTDCLEDSKNIANPSGNGIHYVCAKMGSATFDCPAFSQYNGFRLCDGTECEYRVKYGTH